MHGLPPLSNAVNRLWLPRPSLSACVHSLMARDTLGVDLAPAQRYNHFPATPLCSLSWWLSGRSELLEPGAPPTDTSSRRPAPRPTAFGGPFTRPTVSCCPQPTHGFMLMLMPDALHQLTGIDPQAWRNRLVDPRELLPPDWLAMIDAVRSRADDDGRVALIEDFLEPRWRALRPSAGQRIHRYHDWVEALARRAAISGAGRSLRQVERRIKAWAGLSLRELRGMSRAERVYFESVAAAGAGPLDWADLAASAGYADQSHLCRETRRVTGCTPAELRWRVEHDENFWAYRIWT